MIDRMLPALAAAIIDFVAAVSCSSEASDVKLLAKINEAGSAFANEGGVGTVTGSSVDCRPILRAISSIAM